MGQSSPVQMAADATATAAAAAAAAAADTAADTAASAVATDASDQTQLAQWFHRASGPQVNSVLWNFPSDPGQRLETHRLFAIRVL